MVEVQKIYYLYVARSNREIMQRVLEKVPKGQLSRWMIEAAEMRLQAEGDDPQLQAIRQIVRDELKRLPPAAPAPPANGGKRQTDEQLDDFFGTLEESL